MNKLPSYYLINFRVSYNIILANNDIEFFGRIDNILDKLYYTQLGLPEAGREVFVGFNFKF